MTNYDGYAASYVRVTLDNPHNALLERPAIRALVPPVAGKRVLVAGCAGGVDAEWLVERGADVTAFDISREMIGHASRRLDGRAEVRVHDLAQPLDFAADASCDLVYASLVLHYLEDWTLPLREFRRVLRPGGTLLFSTHHPMADWLDAGGRYFDTVPITQVWEQFDPPLPARFYRRPLRRTLGDLRAAGFQLDVLDEPEPQPEMARRFPDDFLQLNRAPAFMIVRAHSV